jgi:mRNA-binding protein PUF3
LKDYINIFCYNTYGTHVLEKILSYFEDEFTQEIIEYVSNNFIDLSYNMNGICVVKKLLLMTHKKDLHQKLKKIIIENALNLIVHQYGNYVIQVIFENWDDNELEDILNIYKKQFIYLSKLKYSSNAIERIIEKNKNNLEIYINEICTEINLSELMFNNYGNYVIQKAIKLSSGTSQDRIIKEILKNLYIIEDKKIINKWKMIISSKISY